MAIATSSINRILPLSKSVWERINPTNAPLLFDLCTYISPSSTTGLYDGWYMMVRDAIRHKNGNAFMDDYAHGFMKGSGFLTQFGGPTEFKVQRLVVVRVSDALLHFGVMRLSNNEVLYYELAPFDAEDEPIQSWLVPVRDEVFLERVFQLGKGHEQDGVKTYRFDRMIEIAPGLVYTTDANKRASEFCDGKHWVHINKMADEFGTSAALHISPKRFMWFDRTPFADCQVEETSEMIIVRSSKFPWWPSDEDLAQLLDRVRHASGGRIIESDDHKQFVCCLWQKRDDLLPENW